MITISITDDHAMVREGIRQMLSGYEEFTFSGQYANGTDLLEGLKTVQPDVLLLDIEMPGIKGDETAFSVLEEYPEIKIIAVTNFDSILYLRNMLKAGVKGYVLKTTSRETLYEAIHTVISGKVFIEPELRSKVDIAVKKNEQYKYHRLALTIREMEIVKLLVQGLSNQQIAEKLFISFNTMRNHRARIFSKLDVNTLSELVKKTIEKGIV